MKVKINYGKLVDSPYSKETKDAFIFEDPDAISQLANELRNGNASTAARALSRLAFQHNMTTPPGGLNVPICGTTRIGLPVASATDSGRSPEITSRQSIAKVFSRARLSRWLRRGPALYGSPRIRASEGTHRPYGRHPQISLTSETECRTVSPMVRTRSGFSRRGRYYGCTRGFGPNIHSLHK